MPPADDVAAAVWERFPEVVFVDSHGQAVLYVPAGELADIVRFLFAEQQFAQVVDVTAVDHQRNVTRDVPGVALERFEVVANLLSHLRNRRLRLIAEVPEADPTVPSLTPQFPGVSWPSGRSTTSSGSCSRAIPTSPGSSCPTTGRATPSARTTPRRGSPCSSRRPAWRGRGRSSERWRSSDAASRVARRSVRPPMPSSPPSSCTRPTRARRRCGGRRPTRAGRAGAGRHRRAVARPRSGRRDDDHQHGPAAPVDPRGAADHARARGRDGAPAQAGHRLPPHRHGEDGRGAVVRAGLHERHPHGLRLADPQRDGVLPGGRAAARHRGAAARRRGSGCCSAS